MSQWPFRTVTCINVILVLMNEPKLIREANAPKYDLLFRLYNTEWSSLTTVAYTGYLSIITYSFAQFVWVGVKAVSQT